MDYWLFKLHVFLLEFFNCFSFTFWNLSSAEVSLCKSIFGLDEDFDSTEDLLLYFVAMQQKKSFPGNRFPQENHFPGNRFPQETSDEDYFSI